MEVFRHGPGQGEAVEGAGAPADLVQDHQAPGGGLVEDVGGFMHLHQKGALAPADVVHRAHPGEDAVHDADIGLGGGDKAADVGQEDDEGHLAQDGGFAGHVGAGDDHQGGLVVQGDIVGDKTAGGQDPFDDRVAALGDAEAPALAAGLGPVYWWRLAVSARAARHPERPGPGHLLQPGGLPADLLAQFLKQLDFQLLAGLFGPQQPGLVFLELRGDEALGVDQGLFADKVIRHQMQVGLETSR